MSIIKKAPLILRQIDVGAGGEDTAGHRRRMQKRMSHRGKEKVAARRQKADSGSEYNGLSQPGGGSVARYRRQRRYRRRRALRRLCRSVMAGAENSYV